MYVLDKNLSPSSRRNTNALPSNSVLVQEGEKKRTVYFVNEGVLRAFRSFEDGRRQITHFVFPVDFIGLIDGDYYTKSLEAVEPCVLSSFDSGKLDQLFQTVPDVREEFIKATREMLRTANFLQVMLGRLAPIEKVAAFLIYLHQRLSRDHTHVYIPMNRNDIADYLGLTVETVSRSFTKLRAQGVIKSMDKSSIEICEHSSLVQIAGIALG